MKEENTKEEAEKISKRESRTVKKSTFVITIVIIVLVFAVIIMGESMIAKSREEKILNEVSPSSELIISTPIAVSDDAKVSVANLREVIAPASELISYKYYYTDADVYEKAGHLGKIKVPLTTDKTVYTYSGVISVGTDLDDMQIDVDDENKLINITLDEPYIIANQIDNDSFTAYDVRNSIFTTTDLSEYVELKDELEKKQKDKLDANEDFWKQARKNSEMTIEDLIKASGTAEEYDVSFTWN